MKYKLVGVGLDLVRPCETSASGLLSDALRVANELLQAQVACEAVEIFTENRYVLEVARSPIPGR